MASKSSPSGKNSDPFTEKVNALSNLMSETSSKIQKKEKNFPVSMIIGIIIPVIVLSLLYFCQPSIVTKEDKTRDSKKLFFWTVLITIFAWAILYLYVYFTNSNKG